jgi:hypothetical protein
LTLRLDGRAEQGLAMAEAAAIRLPDGVQASDIVLYKSQYRLALNLNVRVQKDKTYTFTKFVAASREDWGGDAKADLALATDARRAGFDALLDRHRAAWSDLWRSDIAIDGDARAQTAVHSDLYYLLATSTADTRWPMGACGLTPGYTGHAFWDSDSWIFPALLLLHPERAKSLVMFRALTLPAAQARAQARALKGAMYPWEADPENGSEQTPHFAYVLGEREIHVNADIAIAQWQYWLATHDRGWLKDHGWPVIRNVADFWASRASWNAEKRRYEIVHVTSVAESYNDVPNDTFTNVSAQKALRIAAISVLADRAARESNLRRSMANSTPSREAMDDRTRRLYESVGLVDPALPLVKKMAADSDSGVRAEVQKFLANFASQQGVAGDVVVSLGDPEPGVRSQALQALKSSQEPPPMATIEKAFASTKGEGALGLIELIYEREDSELAAIRIRPGPSMIREENGLLAGYVYVDVAGRDIGGYVEEAKRVVRDQIQLPAGYAISWSGQYEAMERVKQRLTVILPLTLFLILLLLYLNTKSFAKTLIIMLAVPFSAVGAIWFLYALGYNMSIGVWVGLIALMGVDAETGVFMLLYLDLAYEKARIEGIHSLKDLQDAIRHGAVKRIRPKFMTVACMFLGLVPILWSTGTGADVMKRIAAPMVGGILTSFLLELMVYPAIYEVWKWNFEVKKQIAAR